MKKTATRPSLREAAATLVVPARFSADAAPGEGKPHRTDTYDFEVLATDLSQKHILPFKARIRARSLDDFPGWVRHEGEEFLCVLSGTVQVFTEFYAPVTLGVGDSTYFDSKMGHAIVSLSKEDAEVIWICTGITALS